MSIEKLSLTSSHVLSGSGFVHHFSVKETYPLHTHDFYEFFYVMKGYAIHIVNDQSQLLSQDSFILIRPDDVHKYEAFNHFDFELISIGFTSSSFIHAVNYLNFSPVILNSLELPPHLTINTENDFNIKDMLLHIGLKSSPVDRKHYFTSILPLLINCFYRNIQNQSTTYTLPAWLINLIDQMKEKDNFIVGLTRLIELSNISQEHLTREFKKHLNLTPTEFVNTKRIQYATELLLENAFDVTEICFMCGFNNLSHFYHVFKKHYKCSPKEYINNSAFQPKVESSNPKE